MNCDRLKQIGLLVLGALALGMLILPVAGQNQATSNDSFTQPDGQGGPSRLDPSRLAGRGGEEVGDDRDEDLPGFDKVNKGFEKVVSSADGSGSLWDVYINRKTNQLMAELPRGYESHRYFIAVTQASGGLFAGLQGPERFVYWRRYNKRLALIEPELDTRSDGEPQSRSSVERLFTDRVLLDIPIVANGPNGQPVIDLDELLLGQAGSMFGGAAAGLNARLARVIKAKAFPQNVEIALEAPGRNGQLQTFHYSISQIPKSDRGYKPREADERIGYFTTVYRDLGEYQQDKKWKRYINRWHLEKRDPKLSLSPPKEPIVYYIEHTVPIRYRRWIRAGVEYWNEAFRNIGIEQAIEVRYQDAETNAHMDKDPEDVRYNFIRWLNNDISTAIGPSRAHPITGQILDADIVLTDGWIRAYWRWYHEDMPKVATEGMSAETLLWFEQNPDWDPRLLLSTPVERERLALERAHRRDLIARGEAEFQTNHLTSEDRDLTELSEWLGHDHRLCMAAQHMAFDMAFARLTLETLDLVTQADPESGARPGKNSKNKSEGEMLDGIPEWFIGPMLADLTCHEVGHTLGLRHNFKASSIYTMEQINSEEWKGKKAMTGSVMDYNPANFNYEALVDGKGLQGDYTMIKVGPYDLWAIEYGYTFGDPSKVLERTSDPELAYLTDDDTSGPDPYARTYDMGKDTLNYALNQMKIARHHRERILDQFVKKGESWSNARRGYQVTLGQQMRMVSIMANWLGGAHVSRARKGDPDSGAPITVVPAQEQRDALNFVIKNAFYDEAFGLTPELLLHMTVDKWSDRSEGDRSDPTWPVHDQIMGIQATTISMMMNPTTLKRVYDNEFRVPADQDAFTLPEMLNTIVSAGFKELDTKLDGMTFTNRKPMISSFRRNLQTVLVQRLNDLSLMESSMLPRAIHTLATEHIRVLGEKVDKLLKSAGTGQMDEYTVTHLRDLQTRIKKTQDAIKLAM